MAGTFQEEYDALSARIGTVYDVAQGIGATDPMPAADQRNTWNLSSYVASIRQQPVQNDWCLPVGWPDLRKVLEDDPFKNRSGVLARMAILVLVGANGKPILRDDNYIWGNFRFQGAGSYFTGFRTSNDPDTFVSSNTTTNNAISWDASKYIDGKDGEKFVWVEMYWTRAMCYYAGGNGYPSTYAPGILWICGDDTTPIVCTPRFSRNCKAMTGFTYWAAQPYDGEVSQLQTIPPISCSPSLTAFNAVLNMTDISKVEFCEGGAPSLSVRNFAGLLSYCYSLKEFPNILPEGNQVTSVNTIASTCPAIRRYPDVMDYSKVSTNQANFWNYSNYLRQFIEKLPSKMIFPDTLTLSCQFNQMGLVQGDTIARFDDQGHLSGGWFYGWTRNPGYTTDLSVKFQSTPVSWMTAAQKAEVSSYLLNRGFYVYGL